jgi:hypothetical protein
MLVLVGIRETSFFFEIINPLFASLYVYPLEAHTVEKRKAPFLFANI